MSKLPPLQFFDDVFGLWQIWFLLSTYSSGNLSHIWWGKNLSPVTPLCHRAGYFLRWIKAISCFLGAYDDVAFSVLSWLFFSVFNNTPYGSEVVGFNGDGCQHPISDTWLKSKMADTDLVANYQVQPRRLPPNICSPSWIWITTNVRRFWFNVIWSLWPRKHWKHLNHVSVTFLVQLCNLSVYRQIFSAILDFDHVTLLDDFHLSPLNLATSKT